jgi:hypothetical protein
MRTGITVVRSVVMSTAFGVAVAMTLAACGGVGGEGGDGGEARVPARDFSVGTDAPRSTTQTPLEQGRYLLHAPKARWIPSAMQVYYNPEGAPANWDTASMLALLQQTANKWSDVCNIRITVAGTTTTKPFMQKQTSADVDGMSVVGWLTFPADLASFSGNVSWWYRTNAQQEPAIVDADMGLNLARASRFTGESAALNLGGLLTHEWGHMLGIKHSDQAQSVMFANPYNSYTFQQTLRADDAAACAALYGASPHAEAMRVFNWAEQTLNSVFLPLGASAQVDPHGFPTREYSDTGFALQVQGTHLFYRPGVGQVPVGVGTVTDWLPTAQAAGF